MANKSALPSETWTVVVAHRADVGEALSALFGCALDRRGGSVDGLAQEEQDGNKSARRPAETLRRSEYAGRTGHCRCAWS